MSEDYLIKSFLIMHSVEVDGMLDTECNEAEVKELFIKEGRKEGIEIFIKYSCIVSYKVIYYFL